MWNSKKIVSAFLLSVFMLTAPGCIYDNAGCPDVPAGEAEAYLRLQLHLETKSDTRSNPTGGEDGDGREEGLNNECNIYRLDLVIYNSESDNAINENEDAKIKLHLTLTKYELDKYFVKDNTNKNEDYYLLPLESYSFVDNDRILAYANVGSGDLNINVGDPISSLRDLCPSRTFSGSTAKEADNFTMATARAGENSNKLIDGKIYSDYDGNKHTGKEDDPFRAECTIERTAARIDFMFKSSDKDNDGYGKIIYSVVSPSQNKEVAKVWITNICPVNLMQKPSYFFKHVTENFDDLNTIKVCQGETPDPKGIPTNYVIEPTTSDKKGATPPATSDLFGATTKSENDSKFGTANAINTLFTGDVIKDCPEADKGTSGYDKYCILAYTNENTWIGNDFDSNYLTGLAFKAVYVPTTVYSSVSDNADLTAVENYAAGTTIYRFSPTNIADRDRDAGDDRYFSNLEAANKYNGLHPELNGIITEYTNGVCYYNLWLRHANYEANNIPDPAEAIPMEYVIVRNNIYRVGVSFSGPGNPDPGLRDPQNIRSRIFVRKWNVRRHSTIIM